jgi:hypothetical protein
MAGLITGASIGVITILAKVVVVLINTLTVEVTLVRSIPDGMASIW